MTNTPSDGLAEAQRALAEAQAAAAADVPLLEQGRQVASDLRFERQVNGWEARVRAAFTASKGAA